MDSSINKEVEKELLPILRVLKDGLVERLQNPPTVPPSPQGDQETGVFSKDITISKTPPISARLYLPDLTSQELVKLPVLVYFHGGAFCLDSVSNLTETKLMNRLVSLSKFIAIAIEYRLAPEHPLPTVYEDCWTGLKWVASHSLPNNTLNFNNTDPWISNYGDFTRFFIGGDSAGANIAHNIAMQAGKETLPGGVTILGCFLTHPYFWGSKPIGSESRVDFETLFPYRVWNFLYPSAPGGIDNPMMNPVASGAPNLAGLGCSKLLVTVAEKDSLRDRGVLYYNKVKESGWKGEVELVEVEGEDHAFHILQYEKQSALNHIKLLAAFLLKCSQTE